MEFPHIQAILLDPSCSGSGIVNRMDALVDQQIELDPDRLKSLSDFQISMIQHAMKFPNVTRISYSTCSIHWIENEQVVLSVLNNQKGTWKLDTCLENWPRRGTVDSNSFEQSELVKQMVRCEPGQDLTNGFFVAVFSRIS